MTSELTSKQAEVLAFMRAFFALNDQLPPANVIRQHFGWTSDNAAASYQAVLAKRGYIEHNAVGKYRFSRGPVAAEGRAAVDANS